MELKTLHELFLKSAGVTTDTRSIQQGQLFFALKGERFNGNTYASQAVEQGAIAAIVDEAEFHSNDGTTVLVEDVLSTLQALATFHRKTLNLTVIGLTGSNGKTTSKELIRDVLSQKYATLATIGNLNNHIGVPLTLLRLTKEHEYAVIEMGANAQREIAFLANIAQPDYGFITNIGKAHLEGFGGEAGVKKGKKELFDYIETSNGKVFANASDPVMLEISEGMNRILFGTEVNSPDVYLLKKEPTIHFGWSHHSYFSGEQTTQLTGAYNINNIAAAIAIGRYFEVEAELINEALTSYKPENNRSETRHTANNALILDAYNANPSSVQHALESFANYEAPEKLCILGDMYELGDASAVEHTSVVDLLKRLKLEAVLVGEHFEGVDQDTFKTFTTTEEALTWLQGTQLKQKTILLKGSRGMALERLVPAL
ncbi:MAG: UDP-N-acetylmuramoyl-tripeptide--D-alanyl-D-alanine ligase [Flavobacteriales bacterium]|nr:UDP-N-acetylmuramoyl-tripeptide--D-alanyl-D-alanine ligase [Flavobacteriales bacterium]MDG1779679.1 UDP-N-acetylmuramoyl-tripeptide--D-alanyl-D-alanine ligase [Flavobacteriales bacterium]MDG2245623.1 UDP-N-acetylmuramoyl-tripeptide--D-alanyl-D-alanine ligase [Flavobacteriales bacterium]